MAITTMCSKTDEGAFEVTDFSGHEKGRVTHECSLRGTVDFSGALTDGCVKGDSSNGWRGCRVFDSLWMRTTHKGLVLSLGERNGYDDSDFYAIVWDEAEGQTKQVPYATTRGWTYPNWAGVDATPEVLAAYGAWKARLAALADKIRQEAQETIRLRLERAPKLGDRARIVGGRKSKGAEGLVFWIRDGRAGVALSDKKDAKGFHVDVAWVKYDYLDKVAA